MKWRIEKGGIPFIGGGGLLFLIMGGIYLSHPTPPFLIITALSLFLVFFMVFFFRDPLRTIKEREGEILAPADGQIVEIEEVFEEEFLKEKGKKVAIFLHLFDPHINRSPVEGEVKWVCYRRGKFHPAFLKKASKENERNSIGIETPSYKVLVKQIAGTIARRVVSYVEEGQILKKGEKIGLIRFGSRVELFLPEDVQLRVRKGDRVKAGITVIGEIRINSK